MRPAEVRAKVFRLWVSRRALPAGGAGVVETALTIVLVGMDVPFAPALVAVLVYRLFDFWLPICPALMLIPDE